MVTSHKVNRNAPTNAQFKSLFDQIDLGNMTRRRFNRFLYTGTHTLENEREAVYWLGDDLIFPDEVDKALKLAADSSYYRHLSNSLPSGEVLHLLRDEGFLLIPGPKKALKLRDIMSLKRARVRESNGFTRGGKKFAGLCDDMVQPGWIAIKKGVPKDSLYSSWRNKSHMYISQKLDVPNVAELTWCAVVYRLITGEPICPGGQGAWSSSEHEDARFTVSSYDISGEDYYNKIVAVQCNHIIASSHIGFMQVRKL